MTVMTNLTPCESCWPLPITHAVPSPCLNQMAPPRAAAGLVAALLLAGRAADVVAQSHGSQPPSASLEDDVAILLAFRAVGDNSQERLETEQLHAARSRDSDRATQSDRQQAPRQGRQNQNHNSPHSHPRKRVVYLLTSADSDHAEATSRASLAAAAGRT